MKPIAALLFHDILVSPRTRWLFVEIRDRDGAAGFGEATLQGQEDAVARALERLAPALIGAPAGPAALAGHAPTTLAEAAAVSACDLALWDLAARAAGRPLVEALGGARRDRVPLYANINRRTRDRSPAGFAASARTALGAGYEAFKLAPFDEVNQDVCRDGRGEAAAEAGLARIAALREAVGPRRDVMVDCHWRFDEATATALVPRLAALGVVWYECPLPEEPSYLPALRRLRGRANAAGMRLAGCEEFVGLEQNRVFAEAGVYDVMMPDVKYVGGLSTMIALADLLARHGVAFSPHNPSGPICHLASLAVAAAVPACDRLEVQFDESPLFDTLVEPAPPPCRAGAAAVPTGPGLGASMAPAMLARHAARPARVWNRA